MADLPVQGGGLQVSVARDHDLRVQLQQASIYWMTPPLTQRGICDQVASFVLSFELDADRCAIWLAMVDTQRQLLATVPELYLVSLRSVAQRSNRQALQRCWTAHLYYPTLPNPHAAICEIADLLMRDEHDLVILFNTLGRIFQMTPLMNWPSIEATQTLKEILGYFPLDQRLRCVTAVVGSFTAQVDIYTPAHTNEQIATMLLPILSAVPEQFEPLLVSSLVNWPMIESIACLEDAAGDRRQSCEQIILTHNSRLLFARNRANIVQMKETLAFPAKDTKIAVDEDGKALDPLDEARACRICEQNKRSVTFVPCGHLACCASCTLRLNECPICRQVIRRSVFTFMV